MRSVCADGGAGDGDGEGVTECWKFYMASFFEVLETRVREANSLLCVGLDSRADSASALRAECFRLIDATHPFAAAFKPNSAFFEVHGPEGMHVLQEVIAHVPPGIPVVLDAKRGDIGDTSEAYAKAAFDVYGAHCITVSPYLGGDAIAPFIARAECGVFVLCKTSNKGADEFQGLKTSEVLETAEVYLRVATQAQTWNRLNNVGLVVGATDPQSMAQVRVVAPDLWFLVPGIGAQGGDLATSLKAGLRADGLGMLINASRSIARATDPGAEAQRLRDEINDLRLTIDHLRLPSADQSSMVNRQSSIDRLAQDLIDSQCVRFGEFKLKSGLMSPIYLDLRRLITYPQVLKRAASAYIALLCELKFDRIAGLPYAGLPISTAISVAADWPMIYPRKEAKEYGTKADIEGLYEAGETIAIIDDLATTGGAKVEAIQKLEGVGLKIKDIVVLIDRESGAKESLAQSGYTLHAVATLRQLLDVWHASGTITQQQFEDAQRFLGT